MSQFIQIIMNIPIAIAICILVVVLAAVIGPCGSLILVTIKQFNRLLSTIPWPNALHWFLYRPFLIVSNTPLVCIAFNPNQFVFILATMGYRTMGLAIMLVWIALPPCNIYA